MIVKPVSDRSVRCPVKGEFLPESGQQVPDNVFWRTRLKEGDVILVTTSTEKASK